MLNLHNGSLVGLIGIPGHDADLLTHPDGVELKLADRAFHIEATAAGNLQQGLVVGNRRFGIGQADHGAVKFRNHLAGVGLLLHDLEFRLGHLDLEFLILDLCLLFGPHSGDFRRSIAGVPVDAVVDGGIIAAARVQIKEGEAVDEAGGAVLLCDGQAHQLDSVLLGHRAVIFIPLRMLEADKEYILLGVREQQRHHVFIHHGGRAQPAVSGCQRRAAGTGIGQKILTLQIKIRQIGHRLRRLCRLGLHHLMVGDGYIGVDHGQFLFGRLQIQLGLLHGQLLLPQGNVGQGRVISKEHITLFHLLAVGHQNVQHLLRLAEKRRLNPVGGDHAAGFIAAVIVVRHAGDAVGKAVHIDRLPVVPAQYNRRRNAANDNHRGYGNPNPLLSLFHPRTPPCCRS